MKTNYLILFALWVALFGCTERIADPDDEPRQPTDISGTISGTLSLANSPYIVSDDLTVDSLTTLTIEAGVELRFAAQKRLTVRGQIVAEGNANQPILFIAESGNWQGIHIRNTLMQSRFEFCTISDARIDVVGVVDFGAVALESAGARFLNCLFEDNIGDYGGAIGANDAILFLRNCIFSGNSCSTSGGAVFAQNTLLTIENCTIYNNNSDNVGGGVVIRNNLDATLQNNIFFRNTNIFGDPRIDLAGGNMTAVVDDFNFKWSGSDDPLFVSATDLHLQSGSPSIDAGNPGAVFNDADGSRNDQGAYGGPRGNW